MAEKKYEYEMVEAFISRYPDSDKVVFADKRLREGEIFRGPVKDWRFTDDGFIEFLKIHNISPEIQIAIARDGFDTFAVIQIIKF